MLVNVYHRLISLKNDFDYILTFKYEKFIRIVKKNEDII